MTSSGIIVVAAGGTGGHLFPAAALSGELMVRGWGVVLITDSRGAQNAENSFVGDVKIHVVRSGTPAGSNLVTAIWVLLQIAIGTWQAWWLLSRLRPAVVVGFGGYPSLPTMWAAIQRGIPTMVHEQNAVLGRVNRVFARRVRGIALSHSETDRLPASIRAKVVVTGNPVRPAVSQWRKQPYEIAAEDGPFRLLVVGGSQGAAILGRVVPKALAALPKALQLRLDVNQQCRAEDINDAGATYRASEITNALRTFFDDVGERLGRAHLVVSRAGASSISELACVGRPAIIVPLPHAADDHQTINARAFAQDGAAHVLSQEDQFTSEQLSVLIGELMANPAQLQDMAASARAQGRVDCEVALANFAEEIAGSSSHKSFAGAAQ